MYSYGRQPEALQWNLTRLAECLLPFADKDALVEALQGFVPAFRLDYDAATIRRLGIPSAGAEADAILANAWWKALAESQMPFERAFFLAFGGVVGGGSFPPSSRRFRRR